MNILGSSSDTKCRCNWNCWIDNIGVCVLYSRNNPKGKTFFSSGSTGTKTAVITTVAVVVIIFGICAAVAIPIGIIVSKNSGIVFSYESS